MLCMAWRLHYGGRSDGVMNVLCCFLSDVAHLCAGVASVQIICQGRVGVRGPGKSGVEGDLGSGMDAAKLDSVTRVVIVEMLAEWAEHGAMVGGGAKKDVRYRTVSSVGEDVR